MVGVEDAEEMDVLRDCLDLDSVCHAHAASLTHGVARERFDLTLLVEEVSLLKPVQVALQKLNDAPRNQVAFGPVGTSPGYHCVRPVSEFVLHVHKRRVSVGGCMLNRKYFHLIILREDHLDPEDCRW